MCLIKFNCASVFYILLCTLMTSANISLEKKIFHRVENVIKQLVHTSAVRSSRYEALGKFRENKLLNCIPIILNRPTNKTSRHDVWTED